MYVPSHFEAPDAELERFLADLPAADLVTRSPSGLVSSTLPLLFDPSVGSRGRFIGHLARANPQWSDLQSDEALVLVRGAEAYVSPSYYPSKAEHPEVVPTWNYLSVQARGRLVVHDDPEWTERLVRRLTAHHESKRSEPWSVDDAPASYLQGQLRAIVGIEILVSELQGKWKLSQNRAPVDRGGVATALASGGADELEVAEAMRRLEPDH